MTGNTQTVDIIDAVFGKGRNIIAYRPDLKPLTGSVSATILLSQVVYWWQKQGKQKFYKFRNKCTHEFYKDGDSWIEELGFSDKEFDSALKRIGFKLGKTKNKISKEKAVITYYRDRTGLTWYDVDEQLLSSCLFGNYKEVAKTASTKVVAETANSNSITEITTETTTDINSVFEELWNIYPNKDGKKQALKYFKTSVKNDEDIINIRLAIKNYLKSDKVKKGYIKNGSTWFNNWKDWIKIEIPLDNKPLDQWTDEELLTQYTQEEVDDYRLNKDKTHYD